MKSDWIISLALILDYVTVDKSFNLSGPISSFMNKGVRFDPLIHDSVSQSKLLKFIRNEKFYEECAQSYPQLLPCSLNS